MTIQDAKSSKIPLFLGCLSVIADVCGLIAFASGFAQPNSSSFFMHPVLWAVIQFSITLYGNIALAFFFMLIINGIYREYSSYIESDVEKTYLLFVFLVWVPSIAIWLSSLYVLSGGHEWVVGFIGISAFFGIPLGGLMVASFGSLTARTLRPDLGVRVTIK